MYPAPTLWEPPLIKRFLGSGVGPPSRAANTAFGMGWSAAAQTRGTKSFHPMGAAESGSARAGVTTSWRSSPISVRAPPPGIRSTGSTTRAATNPGIAAGRRGPSSSETNPDPPTPWAPATWPGLIAGRRGSTSTPHGLPRHVQEQRGGDGRLSRRERQRPRDQPHRNRGDREEVK
jgi:hypothetical protein